MPYQSLGGVAKGALALNTWWHVDKVVMRRKVLAIAPQFHIFDMSGAMLLYCHQKLFKLKEDIRVYADESKQTEILTIKARSIIDFSAAYDVVDAQTQERVGVLRRRGWKSILRDEWHILDAGEQHIGTLQESGAAWLRRVLSFLPQRYELRLGEEVVGHIRQYWNPFVFKAEMDLGADALRRLDRRLALAAGLLLMAIDRRQNQV